MTVEMRIIVDTRSSWNRTYEAIWALYYAWAELKLYNHPAQTRSLNSPVMWPKSPREPMGETS